MVVNLLTYHKVRIWNWSSATGVTSEAGTDFLSGAHEFTSGFLWDSNFNFLCSVLNIVVCLLSIVLSVLPRFADSDYPFGIVKLFLLSCMYFTLHLYLYFVDCIRHLNMNRIRRINFVWQNNCQFKLFSGLHEGKFVYICLLNVDRLAIGSPSPKFYLSINEKKCIMFWWI